jgi:ABC-2 type transport system permease protein
MNHLAVFLGAFKYEFRMQIRRRALWITMALIVFVVVGILGRQQRLLDAITHLNSIPLLTDVVEWTNLVNIILPVGVGIMLADRLPRDRRMKVDELFTSLPGALSARLNGKYLGSMFASLVPVLAFYIVGLGVIFSQTYNLMIVPYALAAVATIMLPGMLFISAFSIACPAIMWVPLYQFLFVGYWFWGNWLGQNAGIPTLSATILTPVGGYMSLGFFGVQSGRVGSIQATPLQGIESISLLLGITVLVMFVLWQLLKWQQARQ